jgi:PAS domain S-box-containing protein
MTKDKHKSEVKPGNEASDLRQRTETSRRTGRSSAGTTHYEQPVMMPKGLGEKYPILLDIASVPILIANADGNILAANKKAEYCFGYKKKELIQMNITQIHPKEEFEKVMYVFRGMRERRLSTCHNTKVVRKDGRLIPVDITGSVIEYGGEKLIPGIFWDITEHKQMEEKLERQGKRLKRIVEERTAELRRSKEDLESKSRTLEGLNTALKVLLHRREEDRKEMEERFVSNVKQLVLPYVEEMKKGYPSPHHHSCLSIIESNLKELMSPFLHSVRQLNLSPREIQVASLIRDGKRTKEISDIIGVAPSAIDFYRKNIRRKLYLNNKKHNLQSYLQSLG